MHRLDGKTALITGAGRGIGRAIAKLFAAEGAQVAVTSRTRANVDSVVAEITAAGGKAIGIPCDVAREQDVKDAIAGAVASFGGLDILVNNAGYGRFGKITELDAAGEANEIAVNVTALTLLSRAALVAMAPRKSGGILNVASLASFIPFPGFTTYAATKAYVRHFTLALHEEAKPFGVKVTCVAPGFTPTGFQERGGLSQSSGVPSFDRAALRAIYAANPLPPLPPAGLTTMVPFSTR